MYVAYVCYCTLPIDRAGGGAKNHEKKKKVVSRALEREVIITAIIIEAMIYSLTAGEHDHPSCDVWGTHMTT